MTGDVTINFNLKGLEEFTKKMGSYVARVGIINDQAAQQHDKTSLTNAEIGVIQQFGSLTNNIPPRDFLLMPIQKNRREILNAVNNPKLRRAVADGDYKKAYGILGAVGVGFIQQAFETGGFGQWEPNAPATIAAKGSSAPLIDTGQLRRAISSDVVNKSQATGAIGEVGT